MTSKVTSMREAVAELVRDGDTVAVEGFTHLICFSAGHEIIRQRKRDLTLARLTPDLVYDQMVAAGVARKLIFSWLGNPGVGGLHAIRRRIEAGTTAPHRRGDAAPEGASPATGSQLERDQRVAAATHAAPAPLELEEYSHFGMVGRYTAGAMNLPFFPLRSYFESDLPRVNPLIRPVRSPYGQETVYAVPPLKPDVTIIHAQRADATGNTQVWGLLGCQKEASFAARRVIVVVEELVDEQVVRSDPNRTILPGMIVDAVVVEPFGAHPSYAQGYYDRDNRFYLEWDSISRDAGRLDEWLREWVFGVADRAGYVEKLGEERLKSLKPGPAPSGSVDYGAYR
jgi:glutaconate CoA-transferase subunit A